MNSKETDQPEKEPWQIVGSYHMFNNISHIDATCVVTHWDKSLPNRVEISLYPLSKANPFYVDANQLTPLLDYFQNAKSCQTNYSN